MTDLAPHASADRVVTGPAPAGRAAPTPHGFDPGRAYRLHARAAVRPEPFGALVYHYGNRRLVFLRAPELVQVVTSLESHPSAAAAIAAAGVDPSRQPSFERALGSLLRSEVIERRDPATEDVP